MRRRERLTRHFTDGANSLVHWTRHVPPLKVVRNFIVIYLCRYLPALGLKRWLYRRIGVKVGRDVSVGLGAVLDVFWPELIELGDGCVIGFNSTVLTHEFLIREYRTGPVRIGKGAMIGANATILAGVEIGDGAVVSALSLVNDDVPPGAKVMGVPAVVVGRPGRGLPEKQEPDDQTEM